MVVHNGARGSVDVAQQATLSRANPTAFLNKRDEVLFVEDVHLTKRQTEREEKKKEKAI